MTVDYKNIPPPNKNRRLEFYAVVACPLFCLFILCANVYLESFSHEVFQDSSFFANIREFDTGTKNSIDLPPPPPPLPSSCTSPEFKVDCQPRGIVTKDSCIKLGCCFAQSSGPDPACFYPANFASVSIQNITNTTSGISAILVPTYQTPFSPSVENAVITFTIADKRLTISISDISTHEFESNITVESSIYRIEVLKNGFQIIRKSTNRILFDTTVSAFFLGELYFQMSTRLASEFIYGLGDNVDNFPIDLNWKTKTIFTHDRVPDKENGYTYMPVYMCVEPDRKSHLVYIDTLTATDFTLQPGLLTVRSLQTRMVSIQMVFGESPLDAIQNAPAETQMPPYWSLGFHLSRFGYKSTQDVMRIYADMINAKIPWDVQWLDIDYMENRNDFTIGKDFIDLPNFTKLLHANDMKLVLILDPGVSASEPEGSYPPYDLGLEMDVFVKDVSGKKPLIGKVWNKNATVFPDFFHPNALKYWSQMLDILHKKVPFDGIWLDMNDPSNFVNGSISGCPENILETPPYIPNVDGGRLNYNTLCMTAHHSVGGYPFPHFLVHNYFGDQESTVTFKALSSLLKKRPFIISRSVTFKSIVGHWTGDVYSTWDDMAQSVKDLLNYSIFGISMVGADICGFNGNTTADLCRRWSQLGAFYPFSRNHNTDDGIPQDPVSIGIVKSTKSALEIRYSLLPYLYTLFWEKNQFHLPIIRPSFYMFPDFIATHNISTQFFWGESLLIVPVLEKGFTYVKAYVGNFVWYDLRTNEFINNTEATIILPAPNDIIPLLIRGGRIIPMQTPGLTTVKTRKNPMFLKVALNEKGNAVGNIYMDDGESLYVDETLFSTIGWYAFPGRLESRVEYQNYKTDTRLKRIEIFSVGKVTNVTLDTKMCSFTYNETSKVLIVTVDVPVLSNFTVMWK